MTIHRGAEQSLMRSHHVVGPTPENALTGHWGAGLQDLS